ncbi:MAG: SDR family oxidoreductase [Burkholderiales bacterium]|jgi:NAD(P)-dependent dehydrogenase (short-subunit alcohol dehydrogenase family)|nr:SDR family oxidoreductase [Burkholderiales bacterium]
MIPSFSLAGRRAIVTAGANGIGLAIATTFADAGARVHVCDVDTAALDALRRTHPAIGASRVDVSIPAEVERLFDDAATTLGGGLDILVNNAGIAGPTGKVEDLSIPDWDRCIAVDLNAMFYCTRLAMPLIKAAGGGSVINLSSAAGRLGFPLRSPYAAAKWAVVGFSASLAMEAGPDQVRVNCIQPGVVEGDRIDRVAAAKAQAWGLSMEAVRARMVERVSMRTMVSAQDIANTALFLASEAGCHISGQAIPVCGNLEVMT